MWQNRSEEVLKYYLYKKPALKTFLWEMFDGKKSVGENTFVTAD